MGDNGSDSVGNSFAVNNYLIGQVKVRPAILKSLKNPHLFVKLKLIFDGFSSPYDLLISDI